jgi:hypothetical protein
MKETVIKKLIEEYPSVSIAYDLSLKSSESLLKRLEAVEGRLQWILTAGVTITAGYSVALKGQQVNLHSKLFYCAAACFILAIAIGSIARGFGKFEILNPAKLFNDYLHEDEWEFKKDMIYWQGNMFNKNLRLVNLKAHLANIVATLFFLQVALLSVWVMMGVP